MIALLIFGFFSFCYSQPAAIPTGATKWVGTWSTAPQLVEPGNMPPSPGLTNNSLRQVIRVSIGGDTLRVRFSNEFSTSAVTMNSVQIAASSGGNTIDVATNKELTFSGNSAVTMNAGAAVTSDPIAFTLTPRMDVAITIYYGQTSATVTGHPGSRTTSYIIAGNTTTRTDFTGSVTTDHWYNINGIDVLAPETAACVAILGNSITDGRGSTTNMQNRWPDIFSESLLKDSSTHQVGVLNMGIGGNSVLSGGLGPTGVNRYDRDILHQQGVRWAIVFEGVNDIGGVHSAAAATTTANSLIAAYQQMIVKAHTNDIRIYGGTIMPFKGNGYYNEYSESCRSTVNQWIRTEGNFDACIDFDKTMRDPQDTTRLVSSYQNDGLHPDSAGHRKMGESIDLNLFTAPDSTTMGVNSTNTIHGYALRQNYPNPFNPSTNLSFGLPSKSFVSLKVFDTIGREVTTIVSEELPAGNHTRQWNAANMSSGIYFYRLQAGSFIETKKSVLLR
jgi:lysophospholipase L1-like esterase